MSDTVTEMHERVQRWMKWATELDSEVGKLKAELAAAEAKVARLREAVSRIADRNHTYVGGLSQDVHHDDIMALREALKEVQHDA